MSPLVTPWLVTRSVYCDAGLPTWNVFFTAMGVPVARRNVIGPNTTVSAAVPTSEMNRMASASRLDVRRRTHVSTTTAERQYISPPETDGQRENQRGLVCLAEDVLT